MEPDQARRFVRPDLVPNCLHWLIQQTTLVGKEIYECALAQYILATDESINPSNAENQSLKTGKL